MKKNILLGIFFSICFHKNTFGQITSATFEAPKSFGIAVNPDNARPYNMSIGDLNNDGKPDIAVSRYSSGLNILENTTTGNDITLGTYFSLVTTDRPTDIAIGDIDGDGKAELMAVGDGNGSTVVSKLTIFPNINDASSLSSSSFGTPIDSTLGVTSKFHLTFDDADNDGKKDVLAIGATSNSVYIYRNVSSEPGTLLLSPKQTSPYGAFNAPNDIALVDMNADGLKDLFIGGSGNAGKIFKNITTESNVAFDYGFTRFEPSFGGSANSIAFADLDGDSKPEALVARASTGLNQVYIYRNNGTGTDWVYSGGSICGSQCANTTETFTGEAPSGIAVGDIDKDGKIDVVVSNFESDNITVLRNISTGIGANNIAMVSEFIESGGTGSGPKSIALSDMDGDGYLDIVVLNQASSKVTVLRNKGMVSATNSSSISSSLVNVSPNPVRDNFMLVGEGLTTGSSINAVLVNTLGEIILERNLSNNNGAFEEEFNINSLDAGVYTLLVKTGEAVIAKKIVKQ